MPACPSVRSARTGGKTCASGSGPTWTSGAGLRAKRASCPRRSTRACSEKDGGDRPHRGATAALKRTAAGSDRSKTEAQSGVERKMTSPNEQEALPPSPVSPRAGHDRSAYRLAGLGSR
ncbi:hypothetical protein REMIM1_PE00095 (plasmid) [Rhizobium etli bv. mimosae str. Mim1]|nr:hypothetical protein REMIM1_PE00095 [Rhizobium etli bv. mimosae str. Mim1]